MSDPLDFLPPLANESAMGKNTKARREQELLRLSIKKAEARLKELEKREKEQA